MDWRRRRYYTVILPSHEYNRYKDLIKESIGVKLHPAVYPPRKFNSEAGIYSRKFDDEIKQRGYYHFLVSVPKNCAVNNLMYLFNTISRECAENGWIFKWNEIAPRRRQ